jgi:hypothetical protein
VAPKGEQDDVVIRLNIVHVLNLGCDGLSCYRLFNTAQVLGGREGIGACWLVCHAHVQQQYGYWTLHSIEKAVPPWSSQYFSA